MVSQRHASIFLVAFAVSLGIDGARVSPAAAGAFVEGSYFCLPNYKKWKSKYGWRAFALNKARGKGQICGWSYGATSQKEAVARALLECRRNERKYPGYGVRASCYVYDVRR